METPLFECVFLKKVSEVCLICVLREIEKESEVVVVVINDNCKLHLVFVSERERKSE